MRRGKERWRNNGGEERLLTLLQSIILPCSLVISFFILVKSPKCSSKLSAIYLQQYLYWGEDRAAFFPAIRIYGWTRSRYCPSIISRITTSTWLVSISSWLLLSVSWMMVVSYPLERVDANFLESTDWPSVMMKTTHQLTKAREIFCDWMINWGMEEKEEIQSANEREYKPKDEWSRFTYPGEFV